MNVFYLCNRKKCKECSDECKLTTDVRYAANFNLEEGKELVKKDYLTQEELILKHLRYLIDEMGDEKKASEVMRGIACFYLKGIENAKSVKMGLVKCSSYKEFEDCLKGGESNVTRCEIK